MSDNVEVDEVDSDEAIIIINESGGTFETTNTSR